jgi:hypothetical protein
MRNLKLPEGMLSVSAFDKSFNADENGTVRDLEDHEAAAIMAHDPRITEFVTDGVGDPAAAPGANDKKIRFLSRVARLDRTEMFAAGRAMKVSLPANLKTEQMREILLTHAAAADENDLPLIIGGDAVDDGTPSALTGNDLTDPNHGNASLGQRGIHQTGNTGSTFSQESLTAAPAPATPAPSGLGPVQLTGTQQPPFNQLNTETGRPSHDDTMAPFPISVPPINPQTGKPFDADDPRIPASALPIQRTTTPPGEQLIDRGDVWDGVGERPAVSGTAMIGKPGDPAADLALANPGTADLDGKPKPDAVTDATNHAAVDAHETAAADKIHAAAAELDAATTK